MGVLLVTRKFVTQFITAVVTFIHFIMFFACILLEVFTTTIMFYLSGIQKHFLGFHSISHGLFEPSSRSVRGTFTMFNTIEMSCVWDIKFRYGVKCEFRLVLSRCLISEFDYFLNRYTFTFQVINRLHNKCIHCMFVMSQYITDVYYIFMYNLLNLVFKQRKNAEVG